jgi:hypothetical protein
MDKDVSAHGPQQMVEELVVSAVPARDRKQRRQRRGKLDLAQLAAQGHLHQPLHGLVVEGAQQERHDQGEPIGDHVGVAAIGVWRFVPESPIKTPSKVDGQGAVLLSATLIALLLAMTEGPTWGWGSGRVIGLFVASVAARQRHQDP